MAETKWNFTGNLLVFNDICVINNKPEEILIHKLKSALITTWVGGMATFPLERKQKRQLFPLR
ncbi:MAG: hypothetical protein Kow0068_16750 [Marinilabiliales bacterium]